MLPGIMMMPARLLMRILWLLVLLGLLLVL